jgi:hypothetical protein
MNAVVCRIGRVDRKNDVSLFSALCGVVVLDPSAAAVFLVLRAIHALRCSIEADRCLFVCLREKKKKYNVV